MQQHEAEWLAEKLFFVEVERMILHRKKCVCDSAVASLLPNLLAAKILPAVEGLSVSRPLKYIHCHGGGTCPVVSVI